MPINLSKGQKVDLTKGNPGLKNVMVGLDGMLMHLIRGLILILMQPHLW